MSKAIAHLNRWLVVIPSRLGSTRLPEKALCDLGGKPLIVRVYETTSKLRELGAHVVVATDHEKIIAMCEKHHIPCQMTSSSHQSGSDRCAEVASKSDKEFIMNVQGDEPFLKSDELVALATMLERRPDIPMGTLVAPSSEESLYHDPNAVKTVISKDDTAIYFSRSSIPYYQNTESDLKTFWFHVGVYAFKRQALLDFVKTPRTFLEITESLEQLRAIENGLRIGVVKVSQPSLNINTPEDLNAARLIFSTLHKN
jgi:3-deoxy-manno-octulosonate cytidylyltransferase (CMP-KDO synthetase)